MSDNLKASSDFIKLLLSTSRKQARALIKSANPQQVDALCEIGINLLTLTVPIKVKRLINKCKGLLKKLGKKHFSSLSKIKLILRHIRTFLSILYSLRPLLLELLQ